MEHSLENEDENQVNDIRTENEIKKIKLALEHGMDMSQFVSNPNLPQEIEGQFLDYISEFEKQFAERKLISVYDLTGKPAWKPITEIPKDNIAAELNRITEILNNSGIVLDTLCDVGQSELYRFITEELFLHEMDDIRIPGMTHNFIYEEFHPNHEYDIKRRCTELIEHITDKGKSELEPWGLDESVVLGETKYTKTELNNKLISFRDSFSSITVHSFEYIKIMLNDEKNIAEVLAEIKLFSCN